MKGQIKAINGKFEYFMDGKMLGESYNEVNAHKMLEHWAKKEHNKPGSIDEFRKLAKLR
jgi:hypothetical protein